MSGRSRTLSIEILGDASSADKALGSLEKSSEGLGSKLGNVAKIGGTALAAVGVAAGALAVDSARAFVGFQNQMNEVFTLLPGISRDAMDEMTGQVLDFSKEFGTLPEEVVPALYQSLSAGVPPGNVFEFLETAQKAAIGGVTDLETAVDGISSVVNAYGTDVLGAAEASDLMFTAVRLGKTDFEQLSSSLFNVIPTAASLGVGFGDVTAALATLTAQGTPTSVATTQIRQALVEASKAGGDLDTALRDLTGQGFTELIAGGADIGTIFQDLRESMPEEEFRGLFGSVEAMNAVLGLTGPNAETFADNLDAMGESAGATDGAFEQMDTGVQRSIDKIKANLSAMRLELGSRLMPVVEGLTSFLLDRGVPALNSLFDIMGDVAGLLQQGDIAGAFDRIRDAIGGLAERALEAVGSVDWAGVGGAILDAIMSSLSATADAGMRFVGWLADQLMSVDYAGLAGSLWSGIVSGLGMVADAGMQLVNWLVSTVTGIDYSGLASALWDGALSGLGMVADAGQRMIEWISTTLQGVDWSGLGTTISDGFMSAVSMVTDFGQRVVGWISEQLGAADWSALQSSMQNGLGMAFESLQSLGENEGLQNFISMIEDRLAPALEVLSNDIMPILQPTIDNLKEAFQQIGDTLSERAGPLFEQLQETLEALEPVVKTLGLVVGGVLLAALIGLGEFLAKVLPPAVELALSLIETFLGIIETLAETVTNVVDVVKALIEGDWSKAWEEAKELVTDFVGGMIDALSPTVETISGIFGDLMGAVQGILGSLADWMLNEGGPALVSKLAEGVAWLVSEAPGGVFHLWVNLNTRILELLGSLATWLLTEGGPKLVSELVGGLADLFSEDNIKGAVGQFVKLASDVNTKIAELGTWLLTEGGPMLVGKIVSGLSDLFSEDTIVGGVGQFIQWSSDVNTKIGEIATEALGWAASVAGAFIQGLIDNMTSFEALDRVFNAAKSLGQSMLDGAKSVLGIESPSKEAKRIGNWFMEGLLAGLESMTDAIIKAIEHLGEVLVATLNDVLVIPHEKDSREGYDVGKKFGGGVAKGVEDSEPDVARAGGSLGAATVEGTEEGMEDSAPRTPGMIGGTKPYRAGGAVGADYGQGVADGVGGTLPANREAGERVGGALGAGVADTEEDAYDHGYEWGWSVGEGAQQGAEDAWDGYDATKWYEPEVQAGTDGGDMPASGGPDEGPSGTPTTGGSGGGNPVPVAGGSSIPDDTLWFIDPDDVLRLFSGASSSPDAAANWLANVTEKYGLTQIRYSGGPLGSPDWWPVGAMLNLLQSNNSTVSTASGSGVAGSSGSGGSSTAIAGGSSGGSSAINLTVNVGNDELVTTVLNAPVAGMSFAVEA